METSTRRRQNQFCFEIERAPQRAGERQPLEHEAEERANGVGVRRRDEHFHCQGRDPRRRRLADDLEIRERRVELAGDQRFDRVDLDPPAPRELAQAVDDLATRGAERVLERRHVRRRRVEFNGAADGKLAAVDRDARRAPGRRHPERHGDGVHSSCENQRRDGATRRAGGTIR
jgi:hypothetical protein